MTDFERAVLEKHNETIALLRQLIALHGAPKTDTDEATTAFLSALAKAMGDFDLSLSSQEVVDFAEADDALGDAMEAANIPLTPTKVGARFREMRDKNYGGIRVVRYGDNWRLERCQEPTKP